MSLKSLIAPFPWTLYSKKLADKIDRPKNVGFFSREESEARNMRYVEAMAGSIEDGNCVRLYWLVDKEDGVIVDTKFQLFGQSALVGAAEVACDLVVGKNYDQARRISGDLIDKQVRDHPNKPAFPQETYPHINLILEAIEEAAEQCSDLPVSLSYAAPPVPFEMRQAAGGGYPGWEDLNEAQQLTVIEEILDRDIRPYIALDGGGVEVLKLQSKLEVIIGYQGNCTSCFSAVGTTLSYIQQVLRAQIHPNLVVTPDLEASIPAK